MLSHERNVLPFETIAILLKVIVLPLKAIILPLKIIVLPLEVIVLVPRKVIQLLIFKFLQVDLKGRCSAGRPKIKSLRELTYFMVHFDVDRGGSVRRLAVSSVSVCTFSVAPTNTASRRPSPFRADPPPVALARPIRT